MGSSTRSLRTRHAVSLIVGVAIAFSALAGIGSGAVGQEAPASPEVVAFPPFPDVPALPEAEARDAGPLNIVATTPIIADLLRQVGGSRVEVNSLLPTNADPHDFEPAPEDLVKVSDAAAVFVHGLHLDEWSEGLIENSGANAPVFVVTRDIETLASDEAEFSEGDPHVWFDPTLVKTMVGNIAADLTTIDPDGSPSFDARTTAYQAALDQLDQAIAERIELISPDQRKMVTNHDALRYYAERYGLTIVGTIVPGMDTRSEPSAKDIGELVELIERENVRAIFSENTVNPGLAEELANQVGITIVDDLYTDSLGDPESGADTYIGLMQTDTRLIVEALR